MDKAKGGGKKPRAGGAKKDLPVKDVDAYLVALPEKERRALEDLRSAIRAAAPHAVESVKYQIPVFKYHGDLVGFAAQKKHLSFYVMSPELVRARTADIKGFDASGGTIHFAPERPLPASLVKKLVKARVAENESRTGKK